jgi:dCMP deaminase
MDIPILDLHADDPEAEADRYAVAVEAWKRKRDRPDWDDYFLGIAQAVAARGECIRSRVGAVLVRDRRIVSTGYNGVGAGKPSCLDGACPRGRSGLPRSSEGGPGYAENPCIATHAEINAFVDALRRGLEPNDGSCTMYLNKEPCEECAPRLREWRLRVVWCDQVQGKGMMT